MSKFFFCEDFFTFFFLKSAKGVSINYVDTFKTASSPSLDLCPHAWNKLAYSVVSSCSVVFLKFLHENSHSSVVK